MAIFLFTGCNYRSARVGSSPQNTIPPDTLSTLEQSISLPSPTLSPVPKRLLTICMGQEPSSLFLYGDSSIAARTIRQAIYDGPFDVVKYQLSPVILEKIPTLENGDISFEPVTVQPGNLIIDSNDQLVKLGEGVAYLPVGCNDSSCAVVSSGQDPAQVHQMVVRFKLRTDIRWSDGEPLTADDSLYSFEVAKSLYPRSRADLITLTQSYEALDATTIAWRGVPGYLASSYAENFFTPLPRHIWENVSPEDLLTAEISNRTPMGWGAYVIDEWTAGDHITFSRNPNYFRNPEGLPAFDKLVFRFVPNAEQAIAALLAGECDYLDETTQLESQISQLLELQETKRVSLVITTGEAWEQIAFGIVSLNPTLPALFQAKELRQAMAHCLDRQQMIDELFAGKSELVDSYVPADHPLFYPEIKSYPFDPQAGAKLLDGLGWLDNDGDPESPRLSQGVLGLQDGTPLEFTFLTTTEEEKQRVAQILKKSLAECGIGIEVIGISPLELFAPGPEGPVFGRNFFTAQFGWVSLSALRPSMEPACFLYTTQEIPGPYPEYPKGWGGANAGGYSNPEFDLACYRALHTLAGDPEHQAAHYQAQAIFAEDLPAIPLYSRPKLTAMRPDMCGVALSPSVNTGLSSLENLDYGEGCK